MPFKNPKENEPMKTTADSIAIPDHVTLKTGQGGLPYLELRCNGAEAHVYLHGGHVLHYQPAGQAPVLWQSEKSFFEPGKPIRGGIPICWPWFGPNPNDPQKPAHGFARLVEWKPIHSSATDTETLVVLQLPEECCAEALLQITVKLSQQLSVVLTTTNRQNSPFSFAEALHTYFAIGDIH
ncbi:MAG: dihydroxy-acid dehydratase, partial [Kiritimatiellaceae bacterium]|nr:dihydroxy-acid dehydratase [Kiritimatiellaceae bacterium]